MRPLAELPRDDVAGVCTDIDGTLTEDSPRGQVLSPAAYAAIARAAKAGLRVIPVTGRAAGFAGTVAMLFPVDAVVAENGAVAFLRDGETLYWDDAETRREQAERLARLRADALATLPFARIADDNGLRQIDLAFDIGERQRLAPDEIAALVALFHRHGARALCSTIHAHAYYGDHDKARMVARLAARLWGEDEAGLAARYVFVGDSPNDQAGFAFFARSVGVANVRRYLGELRPPPRYVTPSPGGAGFAELIDHLLPR